MINVAPNHNLLPNMANRHGLISGATGTGKTVTLRVMAEEFSSLGVPVFMADVKGDLTGIASAYPATFWDLYGQKSCQVRTTVENLGATFLSRLMDLNAVQSGVMALAFKVVRDKNMLLIDLHDLKAILKYLADNAYEFTIEYGNITFQSVGAIQRANQGVPNVASRPSADGVQRLAKLATRLVVDSGR